MTHIKRASDHSGQMISTEFIPVFVAPLVVTRRDDAQNPEFAWASAAGLRSTLGQWDLNGLCQHDAMALGCASAIDTVRSL